MVNRFTSRAQLCLTCAKKNAEKMGHTYIGTEHLLLGIACTDCVGSRILSDKKITEEAIREKIVDFSGIGAILSPYLLPVRDNISPADSWQQTEQGAI